MERKRGRIVALIVTFVTVMTLVMGGAFTTNAETVTYATVTASSAKVRSNTDTSSEVVGSLKNGDQVQILAEVTDANGQVWYKVNVVGGTGYVRGDLVAKGEPQEVDTSANNTITTTDTTSVQTTDNSTTTDNTTTTQTTTADNTQTAADLPDTQVTAMDSTTATVTTSKANVRSGAGTAYSVAGSVAAGDVVTVTGSANDSSGKQWYYITLSNGVQGFIRADLVQLGAPETSEGGENTEVNTETGETGEGTENTENTEGDTTEQPQETQETTGGGNSIVATTSKDSYYVFIDQDGTYQLVKNTDGNPVKYSVEGVLAANDYIQQHGTQKAFGLLDIILLILVVVLAGAVIFLFIRLRNLLYYDDEGGNYEDDNMQYEEEPRPRKAGLFDRFKSRKNDGYDEGYEDGYEDGYPEDGYHEEYPEEGPLPEEEMAPAPNPSTVRPDRNSKPTPRKSRNFADDDDFEFEFLDLDNDNDGKRR